VDEREVHALKAELSERDQAVSQAQAQQQQQQQHVADLEDEIASYKRTIEEQRSRHAAQVKELCLKAQMEEERQRARALSTQWHQEVLAAQRELVEFAVEKLVFQPLLPQLPSTNVEQPPSQDVGQQARERVSSAVAEMGAQVQHLVRSKLVMEWQLGIKERKVAALLDALDVSLTAHSLAENRCLSLHHRARAQRAGEDGHAWSRVEALEHRVQVLSQHLETTNHRAIKMSAGLSQAHHDRDTAVVALEALERRVHTLHADHLEAMVHHTQKTQEEAGHKSKALDVSLRDFLRDEVLQLLTIQEEEQQTHVLALSEELVIHKASQLSVLDRLATMVHRHDAQRRQLTATKEALSRAEVCVCVCSCVCSLACVCMHACVCAGAHTWAWICIYVCVCGCIVCVCEWVRVCWCSSGSWSISGGYAYT